MLNLTLSLRVKYIAKFFTDKFIPCLPCKNFTIIISNPKESIILSKERVKILEGMKGLTVPYG